MFFACTGIQTAWRLQAGLEWDLCALPGLRIHKAPTPGLMFCYCHLELPCAFGKMDAAFSFCTGSANDEASPDSKAASQTATASVPPRSWLYPPQERGTAGLK